MPKIELTMCCCIKGPQRFGHKILVLLSKFYCKVFIYILSSVLKTIPDIVIKTLNFSSGC